MRAVASPGRSAVPAGLAPAAGAGVVLLLLGAGALFLGGSLDGGSFVPFWTLGVGLAVLLAAIVLTLLRSDVPGALGTPNRAAVASPVPVDPAPPLDDAVAEPAGPVSAPELPRPVPARGASPFASSIPAQYASLTVPPPGPAPPSEVPEWEEDLSLPFSAGPHYGTLGAPVPPIGPSTGPAPGGRELEGEVARLRERVRELEAPGPALRPSAPAVAPAISAATRSLEPPVPGPGSARRRCTGCGANLSGGTNDPLCWGCGRPLCATCYWRTTEGGAAHTCPACFARTFGTGLSGGRGLTPPVARPSEPATATVPR